MADSINRDVDLRARFAQTQQAKQKKAADGQYRAQRAEAEYENANRDKIAREGARQRSIAARREEQFDPGFHRLGDINRLGQRGQRAARDRDYDELALIERDLRLLDKNLAAELKSNPERAEMIGRQTDAVRVARARVEAGRADDTNPARGILGGLAMLKANPYYAAAKIAADAAIAVVTAPIALAKIYEGALGAAEPFVDLRMGAADISRGGGFYTPDLINSVYPDDKSKTPAWMRRNGYTPETALGALRSYGVSPTSAAGSVGLLNSIGDAQFAPTLGGLGFDRLAQSLGLAQTLGAKVRGTNAPGMSGDFAFGPGVDGQTYHLPGDRELDGQRNAVASGYFRQLQRVMTAATQAGLDHSQVLSSVEGLMRQTASAGGAEVDSGKLSSYWWRLASSGAPSMRTGEGQMSALSGMQSAINSSGLGGGVSQNAALNMYLGKNGGLPKTSDSLARFLGVDPSNMQPAEKAAFDAALKAGQSGNQAIFSEYAKTFLNADPERWAKIVEGSGIAPKGSYLTPLITSKVTGEGLPGFFARTTGQDLPQGAGLGMGELNGNLRDQILAAANSNDLPASVLGSLVVQESGGNPNAANKATSAVGVAGLTAAARRDMGLPDADRFDPSKNLDAGARYLNRELTAAHGNMREALIRYHDGDGNFDKGIDKGGTAYADNILARANDPVSLKQALAHTGQIGMQGSEESYKIAAGLDAAAPAVLTFNSALDRSAGALDDFAKRVLAAVRSMSFNTGGGAQNLGHPRMP